MGKNLMRQKYASEKCVTWVGTVEWEVRALICVQKIPILLFFPLRLFAVFSEGRTVDATAGRLDASFKELLLSALLLLSGGA